MRTKKRTLLQTAFTTGFTLVEVLIVIVIIGILTTISFGANNKIQIDARDQERASKAATLADALEKYHSRSGEYPSTAALLQTNAENIKTKLQIPNTDPLRMPRSSYFPSITNTNGSKERFAYIGGNPATPAAPGQADCASTTQTPALINDAVCPRFELTWRNESDNSQQSIRSQVGW